MKAKCANCGRISEISDGAKGFICGNCGVMNIPQSEDFGTGEEACGCLVPEGAEWLLPSGEFHVFPTTENPEGLEYATAEGARFTLREWIDYFKTDPRIAREWMKKLGKEGADGFKNLSTLRRKA